MRAPGCNHLFLQHELSYLEPQVYLESGNKARGKSRQWRKQTGISETSKNKKQKEGDDPGG